MAAAVNPKNVPVQLALALDPRTLQQMNRELHLTELFTYKSQNTGTADQWRALAEKFGIRSFRDLTQLPREIGALVQQYLPPLEAPLTSMAVSTQSDQELVLGLYAEKYEKPLALALQIFTEAHVSVDSISPKDPPHTRYEQLVRLAAHHKDELAAHFPKFCVHWLEDIAEVVLTSAKLTKEKREEGGNKAAASGLGDLVDKIVALGGEWDKARSEAAYSAIMAGHVEIAGKLMRLGRIFDYQRYYGFLEAVKRGYEGLVDIFLQPQWITDGERGHGVHAAIEEGREAMVEKLLKVGKISDEAHARAIELAAGKEAILTLLKK